MPDYVQPVTGEQQTTKTLKNSYKSISEEVLAIQRRVASKELMSPATLAEIRLLLSSYYSWMRDQMADLEVEQNKHFYAHREEHKSDVQCERAWLQTGSGEMYTRIRHSMKGLERLISAFKTMLDAAQTEYHSYK